MSKKILYIEDNFDNRLLVKRVLEAADFEVIEAENGLDGLTQAQAIRPALIIVDINLPDIDGFEVTKRLRAMVTFAETPIIALTADVMKGDREKTLRAGCNGYIQKPIDVDRLPEQVAGFLNSPMPR